MIISIGTDIIEIERIEKAIRRSKKFLGRVFTKAEIDYCEKKQLKYQHYAVRFAAKEAVMKALGKGWTNGINWKQIGIKNNQLGQPNILLFEKAKELFDKKGCNNILVSLSHCERYALAYVVLVKNVS